MVPSKYLLKPLDFLSDKVMGASYVLMRWLQAPQWLQDGGWLPGEPSFDERLRSFSLAPASGVGKGLEMSYSPVVNDSVSHA